MTDGPHPDDIDDRFLDALLAEHAGHGPDPGLADRTLRALATTPVSRSDAPPGRRWLVAACALFGLAAVVAVAWLRRDGDEMRSATAPLSEPQEPATRTIPELLRDLGDAAKAPAAEAALVRLGRPAAPALAKTLADPAAPRARVLAVLDAIEADAAETLGAVTQLLSDRETPEELMVPAVRTASTLVPFARREERDAARRAVLLVAFLSGGPGAGGPGNSPRSEMFRDLQIVARFLHRCDAAAATEAELLDLLQSGKSPFERELAARLLVSCPTPRTVDALRRAIASEHPTRVEAAWNLDGGNGRFELSLDAEGMAMTPRAAARSLVAIAAGKDASALGHAWLLEHGSPAEQRAAATELCAIKAAEDDRTAVEAALLAGLASTDLTVLRQSITAIGVQGHLTPALRGRLEKLAAGGAAPIASLVQVVLSRF
ncbi:MAG: hypothetical protein U1E73_04285 [Planctomycetota bacterium]